MLNKSLSRSGIQQYKQLFLIILPFLLTASCAFVFESGATTFGSRIGYLVGFIFYWLFWCLLIPVTLIGRKRITECFSVKLHSFSWHVLACLLLPLVFVYAFIFPSVLRQSHALIIVLSLIIAIVNATAEEVLWRGTYLQLFKNNQWVSLLYAAAGFALWHYAPQVIFVNQRPGGAHSFVLTSFLLGLCYAYVANEQQSIFWTIIAHMLFDFAGLGARLYY